MKRRDFIYLSTIAAGAIIMGCGRSTSSSQSDTPLTSRADALPIPTLLRPTLRGGVSHYDLTLKNAKHSFFEGVETDTYAINGTYLGPTLLMRDGDAISVNIENKLQEATSIHGHGMHLPANMDGGPHQIIDIGKSWSAQYSVNQKACTNWYHSHLMGKTAEHVYKGLAGLIIIEDSESDVLDLPKRYGEDDIPLVLQDRIFKNGQIDYSPSMREVMRGYVGDTYIANGAIEPTFEAEAKEIRFRILNGSNSSVYELGFSDGRSFKQIATDNAFLEAPVSMTRLILSPAERAEIVVDLSSDLNATFSLQEFRENKTFVKIVVNKEATNRTSLPTTLTSLDKLDPAQAIRTRKFTLSGSRGNLQINGKSMDINRIDERIALNEIEIWEVENRMMMDHNFHIHATHFMLLERNGSSANVAENEKGYKDVVYLPANEKVKLIVKMVDYSDDKSPYMYHCHFLEHEDAGMMGQFVVQ